MRERIEILLLFAALLAAAAFVGSFVAGLRAPDASGLPAEGLEVRVGRDGKDSEGDAAASVPPALRVAEPGVRTRVEVLNGAGRTGLARQATGVLRDAGFDVVYFGNASGTDSSVVLDRVGDVDAARAVADALGIRRVESRPVSNLYLDVTVLLGEDWIPEGRDGGAGVGDWVRRLWRRVTG